MNKNIIASYVLILIMTIFINACANSKADTSTDGAPVYRVTKSTGLYDAPNLDAGLIAELPVGTLLKPANNEKFYDCELIVESGTTYTLCLVEVIYTGKTGWVLQKWTERQ